MYDVNSTHPDEFIDHEEIMETLAFAEENKHNETLIDEILEKARKRKGLSHRDAAVLLDCDIEEKNQEIYRLAEQIKKDFYGNRIVMFAPLYLSNYCINGCTYCPYHLKNKHIPRKQLSQEEIRREVIALQDMGHKRLALEAGEDPVHNTMDYYLDSINTIYSIKHKNGAIRRVNINIAATTVDNYRLLKEAGIGTYILFQETYHKKSYLELHPTGPKHDYDYHTTAMDRAMEGGIDDVGIGVLFGLDKYRYEFTGLLMHAEHLEAAFGVGPHTISVPRLRDADDIDSSSFKNGIDDDTFAKLVACIRIAVPYTGMIISTRESKSMPGESPPPGNLPDQRRLPHQRGRLLRTGAGGCPLRAVRRDRQPHPGRGGTLAHGDGLHPQLLHSLLPGGPHRRPLHVPVQERPDPELLPPQRPHDPGGVPDGLRLPGDKGHRRPAHRPGDPECAKPQSPGRGGGKSPSHPGEQPAGFPLLMRSL